MNEQVRCYRLADVLTPEQLEAVKPYMRATFTETWVACNQDQRPRVPIDMAQVRARGALRSAARVCVGWTWLAEFRQIERALYLRAIEAHCPVVMGPPRRPLPDLR